MNNCQFCGEPITQTKGKREKKYCSSNCRVRDFLKKKKEEAKSENKKFIENVQLLDKREIDNFVFPDDLDKIEAE